MKPLFTKPIKNHKNYENLNSTNSEKYLFQISPIPIERSWVIGLTSLEVYNSTFIINSKSNNFELYTDSFDEFQLKK